MTDSATGGSENRCIPPQIFDDDSKWPAVGNAVVFDAGTHCDMNRETEKQHRVWRERVITDRHDGEAARVFLSVQLVDHILSSSDNTRLNPLRYEITVQNVDESGFDVQLRTWDTTRLGRVVVAWAIV